MSSYVAAGGLVLMSTMQMSMPLRNEKNDYECLLKKKRWLNVWMQRKFVSCQFKLDEEQSWNKKCEWWNKIAT